MNKGALSDYCEFMQALRHDSEPTLVLNLAVASCESKSGKSTSMVDFSLLCVTLKKTLRHLLERVTRSTTKETC
jgi:hypothetical protein